jgi:zinc-finger of transposase IS204/IS1001/IS1096/IS1165
VAGRTAIPRLLSTLPDAIAGSMRGDAPLPAGAPSYLCQAVEAHQIRLKLAVNWVCVTFRARFSLVGCFGIIWRMTKTTKLAFGPGIVVQGVAFRGTRWVVSAEGKGSRLCPACGDASGSRHSWQMRRLQELPIQGVPATLELRSGRWKCRNEECSRKTFPETLAIALPSARTTRRVGELVRLFGHAAGGRVSERLLTRLGMPVSDNAILRQLKSHVRKQRKTEPLRAIAIDDWSWRKGFRYGTVVSISSDAR